MSGPSGRSALAREASTAMVASGNMQPPGDGAA
jgi:hypothetical protein